ncbi:hydroxyacid dehydrogenase [Propionivibrio sp.]|uniref:hydroxyacid dehydrogenase n=1 Tax=Propionivibrio sp. TaxID=2212460 RepID=UPI00272EDB29|nr:hydroxyacid dehydrogenase [Propionivibrio sp.]
MAKVVITQRLHDKGMELLEQHAQAVVAGTGNPRELDPFLADADGLIIRIGSIDRQGLLAAKNLKVIGRPGVGVDDVDVATCTELGIPVVIVPGANTRSVAEHAMLLMFATAKDLLRSDQETRRGNFGIRSSFKAYELKGRTLGLIGGGAIGSEFGRMAQGIGMNVMVYDPFLKKDDVEARGWRHVANLDDLYREADVISIHVPLTEQTRNMIGDREFGLMKKDAILINCARGGIIDEDALYRALKENRIHGAGTDVLAKEPFDTTSPLMSLDNFVLTPHMAGQTKEAAAGVATGAVEGVLAVIRGEKWPKVCNPEAYNHPRWK